MLKFRFDRHLALFLPSCKREPICHGCRGRASLRCLTNESAVVSKRQLSGSVIRYCIPPDVLLPINQARRLVFAWVSSFSLKTDL